jgi:hypothetical protein
MSVCITYEKMIFSNDFRILKSNENMLNIVMNCLEFNEKKVFQFHFQKI